MAAEGDGPGAASPEEEAFCARVLSRLEPHAYDAVLAELLDDAARGGVVAARLGAGGLGPEKAGGLQKVAGLGRDCVKLRIASGAALFFLPGLEAADAAVEAFLQANPLQLAGLDAPLVKSAGKA